MRRRHDYRRAKRLRFGLYRVRCVRCGHRRTFTRKPDEHIRLPKCGCRCKRCARLPKGQKCRRCLMGEFWRIDWYRTTKREAKATTCRCDEIPFPHRRGSTYTIDPAQPFFCRYAVRARRRYRSAWASYEQRVT